MGTWKLKNKADLKITSIENFDTGTCNQIEASRSLLSFEKIGKDTIYGLPLCIDVGLDPASSSLLGNLIFSCLL